MCTLLTMCGLDTAKSRVDAFTNTAIHPLSLHFTKTRNERLRLSCDLNVYTSSARRACGMVMDTFCHFVWILL